MKKDLSPEKVLAQIEKGDFLPYYLLYGPDEFRKEQLLTRMRQVFLPESSRDFNLQTFYADEAEAPEILDAARSAPFLADRRLIIVRRVEAFKARDLEVFAPYFENPVHSTCIVFVSIREDAKRLIKLMGKKGGIINFKALRDAQVVSWLRHTSKEMGLRITWEACAYLHEIVGNNLMELYNELEKLFLRYSDKEEVGIEKVQELSIHSREYTIFELVDSLAHKKVEKTLGILRPFLEEGDRDAALRIIGMLNRQIRLMWTTTVFSKKGEKASRIAARLGIREYQVNKLLDQSEQWTEEEFKRFIDGLYEADSLIKTGTPAGLTLENLFISFCGGSWS